MTAKDALILYKNRDASEKLFRGDKSYLGDKSLRIYGDSAAIYYDLRDCLSGSTCDLWYVLLGQLGNTAFHYLDTFNAVSYLLITLGD